MLCSFYKTPREEVSIMVMGGMDSDNQIRNVKVTKPSGGLPGAIYVISEASNPSDSITRPANTTAYTANDVISIVAGENLEFATGFPAGSKFAIFSAIMRSDDAAVISGMTTYRLHLYNAAPTAIADNAAHAVITADAAKYLGYITLSAMEDAGDYVVKRTDGINAVFSLATAGTSIFGQLQTIGAFTPASATVYTIELVLGAL